MRTASINLSKIDKTKLIEGKNGTYLNLVIWDNKEGADQYGYHFAIQQGLSKEDRDAGVKPIYLGNGRIFGDETASQNTGSKFDDLGF